MPPLEPGLSTKYLGARFDPWRGLMKGDLSADLDKYIDKIDLCPLEPTQKLEILLQYVMPRLTYPLSVTNLVLKNLNCLEGKIRSTVKRWLHLPSCTTDNFLYTRTSQGGLGIPCLAKLVPAGRVAAAVMLSQSSDTVTRTLAAQWKVLDEANEVAANSGLPPITRGARLYGPNAYIV